MIVLRPKLYRWENVPDGTVRVCVEKDLHEYCDQVEDLLSNIRDDLIKAREELIKLKGRL